MVFLQQDQGSSLTLCSLCITHYVSQNYRVLLAAVRGGARTSARVGLWTLTYVSLEALIEQARLVSSKRLAVDDAPWNGKWIDGATAGLSIALGASSFCE